MPKIQTTPSILNEALCSERIACIQRRPALSERTDVEATVRSRNDGHEIARGIGGDTNLEEQYQTRRVADEERIVRIGCLSEACIQRSADERESEAGSGAIATGAEDHDRIGLAFFEGGFLNGGSRCDVNGLRIHETLEAVVGKRGA